MAKSKAKENYNGFEIDLSSDVAEGEYSNFSAIAHSSSEFILDHICLLPGMPQAVVKSRVVMTPDNAKRLLLALGDHVLAYEEQYGEIFLSEMEPPVIGGVRGEA